MRFSPLLTALIFALAAQPAGACSGYGPAGHARLADVIVVGDVVDVAGSDFDELVARKVIKGAVSDKYRVLWIGASADDECAFLSPVFQERGVYFLSRQADGSFVVAWTEKRWKGRWRKGF